jgi:hypothetical protein
VLSDLPDERLAGPGEIAQVLDAGRRDEAAADQPVGEQVGDPHGIVHVGLATRHVADVLGVLEHELEIGFQRVPDRLPAHPGRLHGDVGAAVAPEPVGQRQKLTRGRTEGANLVGLRRRHAADAGHDGVFVDVETRTAGSEDLQDTVSSKTRRREEPPSSNALIRAPGPHGPSTPSGVRAGLRVQLLNGLAAPSENRPPSRRSPGCTAPASCSGVRQDGWGTPERAPTPCALGPRALRAQSDPSTTVSCPVRAPRHAQIEASCLARAP